MGTHLSKLNDVLEVERIHQLDADGRQRKTVCVTMGGVLELVLYGFGRDGFFV